MRAVAVFPEERAIRIVDHPEPKLERGSDVCVQMLDVGICGTDREIARFEYGTPPPGFPYLVIGHESGPRANVFACSSIPPCARVRPKTLPSMMPPRSKGWARARTSRA